MPQRVSLKEQYDNRDVIAQIYRLISLVESSTIVRTTSVQEGSTVTVTLDMYDGTSKTFTFTNNADMTTDTEQNVTALKNFLAGLNVTGNTQIDGDTQIVNGHSLQVAGDLDVAGDTEVAGKLTVHGQSEISGMAVEESSGATVLSNANGIKSASPVTLSGDVVVPTTVTGQRDTKAVNGERLQNDLDAYGPMMRLTGNKTVTGTTDYNGTFKANQVFDMGTMTRTYSSVSGVASKLFSFNSDDFSGQYHTTIFFVNPLRSNTDGKMTKSGILIFTNNTNDTPGLYWMVKGSTVALDDWAVSKEGSLVTCWLFGNTSYLNADGVILTRIVENRTAGAFWGTMFDTDETYYTVSDTGYTDNDNVVHTFDSFKRSLAI